jgi:hypothetical protein
MLWKIKKQTESKKTGRKQLRIEELGETWLRRRKPTKGCSAKLLLLLLLISHSHQLPELLVSYSRKRCNKFWHTGCYNKIKYDINIIWSYFPGSNSFTTS